MFYLVLDDFGALGRAYREVDQSQADLEDVIESLLAGQFTKPMRVVWSRDVSEDVAWEVVLAIPGGRVRLDLGADEVARERLDLLLLGSELEVHQS